MSKCAILGVPLVTALRLVMIALGESLVVLSPKLNCTLIAMLLFQYTNYLIIFLIPGR